MDIADQHDMKNQARSLEVIQDYLEGWADRHDEHIENMKRGTHLTQCERGLIAVAVGEARSAVLTLRRIAA